METIGEEYVSRNIGFNDVMQKVFFRMFLGILLTAVTAGVVFYTDLVYSLMLSFNLLCILEIVVVLVFSLFFTKLSSTTVSLLFFGYAILNGVTMATIFAVFDLNSIVYTFLATAALFGALSWYGHTTNKDVSSWRSVLTVGLIAGLILSIINLFLGNTLLEIFLDWLILFVFVGLTIYDTQKIKRMHEANMMEEKHLYVYGAMELYLDFINIFLRILSLFGKRRD